MNDRSIGFNFQYTHLLTANFDFFFVSNGQYGCDFWHWELQYVVYLIENAYFQGEDAAVGAMVWAEERRENLELVQTEKEATMQEMEQGM